MCERSVRERCDREVCHLPLPIHVNRGAEDVKEEGRDTFRDKQNIGRGSKLFIIINKPILFLNQISFTITGKENKKDTS
jgi:hypothetical protein